MPKRWTVTTTGWTARERSTRPGEGQLSRARSEIKALVINPFWQKFVILERSTMLIVAVDINFRIKF